MRNLRNTQYDAWKPPVEFQQRPLTASTWDLANDSVICTIGPTEESSLIELVRVAAKVEPYQHTTITSWDAPCPNPDLSCDVVLSLHYFGDTFTACLVLAGGDIVVVREEPQPGEDRVEIVGSIDEGITSARWSPDEELLAITTKVDTLVFMSRGFEGVNDVTMTSEDLKASNHVSVGWGKKETQFQGKGAKALRDPTLPEKIDQGVLSPNDDCRARISWRGDGAYLAVSTVEGGARRLIRVYSREGALDSVSEPVDGLEGALSWRPAGNLIAGIQRLEDRVDVVFFERNGLRHGQFSLRLSPKQLKNSEDHMSLHWNSDSTVLAVVMATSTQLWTMGNYHWYLKQDIETDRLLLTMPLVWHPEQSLQLMMVATNRLAMFDYILTISRSSTAPPDDHGAVAVIDGQTVKITPLRTANVPPPMALHDIKVASNAIDVAFNASASSIAVLHQGGVSIFEWKDVAAQASEPTLSSRLTFATVEDANVVHQQISFAGTNEVFILKRNGSGSVVARYGFNEDTGRMEEVTPEEVHTSTLLTLSNFYQGTLVHSYVQGRSGDLHSLVLGKQSLAEYNFPMYLPWIEMSGGDDPIAFGLSNNGHLYANSRLLAKNCTSFLTTSAHLIFTTTTNLLKFVHITDVNDLEVPADDPEVDERCRSIERGSRLVTATPTSLSLVLQMPRGNLETIFPRAMVVAGIRKLIDDKNYKKAFSHCRTQRVDMNLLYDHAPEQLLSNVALFIDQVKKVTYIDLFLSSLREEDVTQSMFKETRVTRGGKFGVPATSGTNGLAPELSFAKVSKINRICDAFLFVLQTRPSTNLQNIITANVCKSPPALDDGLLVVAQLMKSSPEMADKAVEHICFLADVNKLYDNSLGLYDLDLALLIAQQSQKDPREYLPFMQNLQSLPELRRKFATDDHLGRHVKALTHLHTMGANTFPELQTYVQKHNLYQHALSLYRYNPSQHAEITALYAAYLESKSSFHEAALAYESLSDYSAATRCYLSSGPFRWQETLTCALSQTPPLSSTALQELATSLYDGLIEVKDFHSAATIQLNYLDSIPTATRAFCRGYHFADALHLVALKSSPELSDEIIDPCLGEALASSTELLAECKAQLLAQVPRIRELRLKALQDPLAFYEGERGHNADDLPDDVSVAASSNVSTNRSLFTRYTGKGSQGGSIGTAGTGVSRATSKNRRREERKRARGKKGSVYEEEYLVASVGRLIQRVETTRPEIERLINGLVRRSMWERARAIEVGLADIVRMCRECVPEVFGAEESDGTEGVMTGADGQETIKVVGADAVFQESMESLGKKKERPAIKGFEKLSLLGT